MCVCVCVCRGGGGGGGLGLAASNKFILFDFVSNRRQKYEGMVNYNLSNLFTKYP